MKLKKRLTAIAVTLLAGALMLAGLSACQQQDPQASGPAVQKEPAGQAAALADSLSKGIPFQDQLTAMDGEKAREVYLLDADAVTEGKVYVSIGATAEEIAVWYAASPEKVDIVKKALEERIDYQRTGFEDYNAQELTKLKNPVLEVKGQYVILCISDDNEKAKSIIDKAFS